jgi:hypothetical protein
MLLSFRQVANACNRYRTYTRLGFRLTAQTPKESVKMARFPVEWMVTGTIRLPLYS